MATIGKDIEKACELLCADELVAIPTETVYGLAGNALSLAAIDKIYTTKMRPRQNPLILHAPNIASIRPTILNFPQIAYDLAAAFWPGPLTLILPKSNLIPDELTAQQDSVAIRIPDHPLTLELLQALPFPLAAPSANPYGYISPTCPEHVEKQLGNNIKYILDGGTCRRGIESTIVGFEDETPVILRQGVITEKDILRISGTIKLAQEHAKIVTAGMSKSHYSPLTPLYLCSDIVTILPRYLDRNIGIISLNQFFEDINADHQIRLSLANDLNEAAKNLYAAMNHLDTLGLEIILTEYLPNEGVGKAMNDRLDRAAHKVLN